MNKFKSALIKTGKFLRKNVYYVVIVVAVAAICAIVGVTVSKTKQAKTARPSSTTRISRVLRTNPRTNPIPWTNPTPSNPIPSCLSYPSKTARSAQVFGNGTRVFKNVGTMEHA